LILGIVLGDLIERYMFISVERYGASWLLRPIVVVMLGMAVMGLLRPFWQDVKIHGGLKRMLTDFGRPHFSPTNLFYVFMIVLIGAMLVQASEWHFSAKLVPMIVGSLALFFAVLSLFNEIFRRPQAVSVAGMGEDAQAE